MNTLIIKHGSIIDGTGNPWYRADIKIHGDIIAAIERNIDPSTEETVNAEGLFVTPGFIDIHSHGDVRLLALPSAPNKVKQGVTTLLVGNCGASAAPLTEKNVSHMKRAYRRVDIEWDWRSFADYMSKLASKDLRLNVACLAGHGTIRSAVMGYEDRPPTEAELQEMKERTAECMKAGAFGFSSGLIYTPGTYAETEELIALGKVVATYDGLYATHMRSEGDNLLDAINEAITIGNACGIPVEISHFKATGENWSKIDAALQRITEGRASNIDVTFDVYPYHASSTSMSSLLPSWAREGGEEEILDRLTDATTRAQILDEMRAREVTWQTQMVSYSEAHSEYEGKRVDELAEGKGKDPYDFFVDLLIEDELATRRVSFSMKEENIPTKLKHPLAAVGSDGGIHAPTLEGKPHPRYYGTFPRVIAKYVRKAAALRLEDAIRKMTSAPAQKIGLPNRGILKAGMKADIVLFDLETIEDTATFVHPIQYPKGIKAVIVNGEIVVKNGAFTGNTPGDVLKRS